MPRGNGTGPMGLGPMTGRGAGFCTGFAAPRYLFLLISMGFGAVIIGMRMLKAYNSKIN